MNTFKKITLAFSLWVSLVVYSIAGVPTSYSRPQRHWVILDEDGPPVIGSLIEVFEQSVWIRCGDEDKPFKLSEISEGGRAHIRSLKK